MFTHRLFIPLAFPILCLLLVAIAPSPADASTITTENNVLVVRGAPGEKNWLTVGPAEQAGALSISDIAQPSADPSLCTPDQYSTFVTCAAPAGGVRLEAGAGDDILDVHDNLPAGLGLTLDGG